jgi:hypothetical protein
MQKRTLLLFTAMLVLFGFYAAMSLQRMPDVQDRLKSQVELLNTLDEGASKQTAHN